MPSPFESFRTVRWLRSINLILQAALILTLVGGLNYLARNHPSRFDLTRYRRYSLSPETLSYLKNLARPVRIVVAQSEDNDAPELRGLLQEYKIATEASRDGRIEIKYIDVLKNHREAEQLGIEQTDVVILLSGDRRRAVPIDELYKSHRIPDKSTNLPGATVSERIAFQGEQTLTAALLDVSSPDRKKIYFLTGHSELNPLNSDPTRGLSEAREFLRRKNFDVDTLDLTTAHKIPADANLIIICAPQSRYRAEEQEMLRQYLGANAGRVLLFLAPGARVDGLGFDDLLLDWGVLVDDDLIWDTGPSNMTEDGELLLFAFQPHPVTQALLNNYGDPLRLGTARTVRPDPGRAAGAGLTTLTLAATSTTAWGEVSYRQGVMEYTPGVDIRPLPGMEPKDRLGVIVAAERVAVREDLAFSVRGGRLVVFGTGDLIANSRISDAGNQNIFMGAVNWTVDRDTQLSIPTRPIERFQLSLSAADLSKLRYALLFALPGITAFLGLIVYWTRRH